MTVPAIIISLLSYVIWVICSVLLSLVLSVINAFGAFMLEPFSFSTKMFTAIFGADFLNVLESIIITGGIAVSILLLIFGLLRVFIGKLNDDVPNPFMLVGRFFVAIFSCYWIIPIVNDYIFPLAQEFFKKILNIDINLIKTSFDNLSETFLTGAHNLFSDIAIAPGAATGLGVAMPFTSLLSIILFLICIIAATVNMFKLVVENAERYFTINTLVLSGPLAVSTFVSEKSQQIFKNWVSALLANIITIIFNLIAFRMIMLAFANCFAVWSGASASLDTGTAIISLVSLVAVSKMAQKFDQIISQILFKINPIQNRSMLMAALATLGSLNKSSQALTGATIRQNLGLDGGRKGGIFTRAHQKDSASTPNPTSDSSAQYDNNIDFKNTQNDNSQPFKGPLHQKASADLRSKLGLDRSNVSLGISSTPDADGRYRVSYGDVYNETKATNPEGRGITPDQANLITKTVNDGLKNGKAIVGIDPEKKEFIVGDKKKHGRGGIYDKPSDAEAISKIMNGEGNIVTVKPKSAGDSEENAKFKNLVNDHNYFYQHDNGHATFYLDLNKTTRP